MQTRDPALSFLLPVAPGLDCAAITEQAAESGLNIVVTNDQLYDVISSCDAIATCSGTVTLEIALLNIPMCILCKISWLSYLIMRRLVTIPHIGLANIVADDSVVREFFQADVNPETLSGELFELIDNRQYREQVKSGLARVRENLGAGDGARKMAQLVLSLLHNNELENVAEE
jgi:lipid-A-disaccharide synthase